MSVYSNLKPNVRKVGLIGGTGNGKTEFGAVPATPEARKILKGNVGNTNSTIVEHLLVYTTEYDDRIVVAAKRDETAFSRNLYTEIIAISFAQVAKNMGKVVASIVGKDLELLEEALRTQLEKRNNIKAMLTLLSADQIDEFVQDIVSLYKKYDFGRNNYSIYNSVKNQLEEGEVKENSKKFLSALQQEVERILDMQSDMFKEELWSIWQKLNDNLAQVFYKYFDENAVSGDGYYFKEIFLEKPDEGFISAMFTSNNLQAGERLSLEVLCSEIVIYVPMNKRFSELIEKDPLTSKVFRDSSDNVVFGILDTKGFYHSDSTDDENDDYCTELVYKGDLDAIVMVVPLWGDTNEKKISELYREALRSFNKQIPIYMLHNKLDLFVGELLKQDYDDPLSTESYNPVEFNVNDLYEQIVDREKQLNEDLKDAQVKAKKRMPVQSLVCYLKRDGSFPREFVEEFNVLKAYESILQGTAKSLEDSSYKIKFTVIEGMTPAPVIDKDKLKKLVHEHIMNSATDKKVFTPGLSDIALSLGKTPHGNAYNALRRRLKLGDGYTSNIDEEYFYNCKSFAVNFTANLRNFASTEFIHSVVFHTLDITGIKKTQDAYEKFAETVSSYVNPKELVSLLLYYKAIQEAEKKAFSFKSKFQNFLQNSIPFFNLGDIDETSYCQAVEMIVIEAAQKALDLNVTFR